jgi:hypothetical protein
MPQLCVDISAHGFGHLAQAAPVLNRLHALRPDIRISIRSGLDRERLARRIEAPFRHVPGASDFGYVMANAIDIDLAATAARYRAFHHDWKSRVEAEAAWLIESGFDAVLSDVAYLPLAGAALAGVPALALCSLNWADLFRHYFGAEPWAAAIHADMLGAYRSARAFLRTAPAMAMADLGNTRPIGPICRLRAADRPAIARQLGIDATKRWVLLAMGGVEFSLDPTHWPRHDDIQWLVPAGSCLAQEEFAVFDSLVTDFTDLLAVADAVVTKPGYGTFVEAACHGVPVLYVPRGDWPEQACLVGWLTAYGQARAIERQALVEGRVHEALGALWGEPRRPVPAPTGVDEAAACLAGLFERRQ